MCETENYVDRLLHFESSGEIVGFKKFERKYVVWRVDDIFKFYREASGAN
jgi:hypothetical protein